MNTDHLSPNLQSTRSRKPRLNLWETKSRMEDFNPRGRKDLDNWICNACAWCIYFNPRGRKDLDSTGRGLPLRIIYFNPRGRKDLDSESIFIPICTSISIHEVAKTSTKRTWRMSREELFQSTRSQRPRHTGLVAEVVSITFQSTRSQRPRL